MTFRQFTDAAKSAWGAVNNVTIIAAVLTLCGIDLVFPSVPGSGAVLACLLCYIAGFLVSCYKVAERAPELAAKDARIVELEKRPTQDELNKLRNQLRTKDNEIEVLKSAKVPTPLDMLKTRLGEDGVSAFRALCTASTYVDGVPARPLVFDLDDAKLTVIGLTADAVRNMADAGAIRLVEADERDVVGSNVCPDMTDVGYGVSASLSKVSFSLAGNESIEVGPVRLAWGTDMLNATGLYGADLGVVSFTTLGADLAATCVASKPPMGMEGYIRNAYSAGMRISRHHFRYLTEEGELKSPYR